MPSYGKEEATPLSSTYQEQQKRIQALLEKQKSILNDKTFAELSDDKQIEYCQNKKAVMEGYWNCFEMARDAEYFEEAINDYTKAFELGFEKANILLLNPTPAAIATNKTIVFSEKQMNHLYAGLRYRLGLGVTQNNEQAFRFIKGAAEKRLPFAQIILGLFYHHGIGVTKDDKAAAKWLRLAAEQGNASGLNHLGHCYQYGIGVTKEEKSAVKCYRLAAEQGDISGLNNLGYCYEIGIGVTKDEKAAVLCYRLAAEQGNASALNNLGYCYQHGIGVTKDEIAAVKCYRLAAERGNTVALDNLKTLTTPLAHYTAALLEKNSDKLIECASNDKALSEAFFEKDIFYAIKQMEDKNTVSTFLQTLAAAIQAFDKNQNTTRTALLLSLEKAIANQLIESNEETAAFMTDLLDNIQLADTDSRHLKKMMLFLCNIDNEGNAKSCVEALSKLWYRSQSFHDFQMDDSGLNRLIAVRIVGYLFDNRYAVAFTEDFSADDVSTLFYAYNRTSPLSVENINNLLSKPLLVESKYHPENLLPALKAHLSNNDNFDGKRPHYIEKLHGALQRTTPDNERAWQALCDTLSQYAGGILVKQGSDALFKSSKTLCNEERQLLKAFSQSNYEAVLEWMDEHTGKHQKDASASASLG